MCYNHWVDGRGGHLAAHLTRLFLGTAVLAAFQVDQVTGVPARLQLGGEPFPAEW